ncbi:hypothetical protein AAE478_000486 [Parahypoxylon ruwenzoriense]
MSDSLPAKNMYHAPTPSGPFPRPMTRAESRPKMSGKTCWWCLPPHELRAKDGWFKTPRDTAWTIDSYVNGKPKPSGYDSNSLITILRSSQCLAAILTLTTYVFTLSVPVLWLVLLASAAAVVSGVWSILALFLRHVWSVWLAIPEFLLMTAWITLFAASSNTTPDDSKASTFRLGMIAIEASMILWIQTCLLMVTPFFHRTMPWLFRAHGSDTRNGPSMNGALEMPTRPPGIVTTARDGTEYPFAMPPVAHPGPIQFQPALPNGQPQYPLTTPQMVYPTPMRAAPTILLQQSTEPVSDWPSPLRTNTLAQGKPIQRGTAAPAGPENGRRRSRSSGSVSSMSVSTASRGKPGSPRPVSPMTPTNMANKPNSPNRRHRPSNDLWV